MKRSVSAAATATWPARTARRSTTAAKGHMTKCDGCYDRVAEGKKPICVESCPLRALDFGPIDELRKKHGELAAVAPLPRAHFTKPNIVIKPNANSRPTGDTTGYLANPKEV
ncbi:Anaerobic dimethyl sulfoxide reductase chain B [Salmonella enterica subsp. enterica]|nr:Anaerobic dimethyl sulfoxide reductase chain B [Salmonella enterica subsp. enterica serovar Veneziana]